MPLAPIISKRARDFILSTASVALTVKGTVIECACVQIFNTFRDFNQPRPPIAWRWSTCLLSICQSKNLNESKSPSRRGWTTRCLWIRPTFLGIVKLPDHPIPSAHSIARALIPTRISNCKDLARFQVRAFRNVKLLYVWGKHWDAFKKHSWVKGELL